VAIRETELRSWKFHAASAVLSEGTSFQMDRRSSSSASAMASVLNFDQDATHNFLKDCWRKVEQAEC
jgi:hypothetical protein